MIYALYFIHVIICIFLILVVLLQQGKGADLSVFGGGSTQTAFGARGATTLLHKLTVSSFVIFILTTLAIGLPKLSGSAGSSVMRGVQKPAAQKPVAPVPASKAPAAPVQAAPTPVQAAPAPVQQAPTPVRPPG